jgi:hypothetical protein
MNAPLPPRLLAKFLCVRTKLITFDTMSTTSIPPARIGDSLVDVDTPALILDLDTFEHNISELQRTLKSAPHVKVRSHAKAHKCPAIALLQVQSGAVGVCCQKVRPDSKPRTKQFDRTERVNNYFYAIVLG